MTGSWFGDCAAVHQALKDAEADFFFGKDDALIFNIHGPITIGIGGTEAIVGPEVEYFMDGEPRSLLELLRTVDGGVMVGVI